MGLNEINEVQINAPAKINLYLDVLNRRDDGYHEVEMVLQSVNLCDVVTIKKTDDCKIRLTCTCKVTNQTQDNAAYIAAKKFFLHTNIKNPGISINIKKRIPQGAGLGGGSTDAAATLIALDRLFNAGVSKSQLAEIGGEIGADVPFCVYSGTMLATGTGTTLSPLPSIAKCWIIIVKPSVFVSTKSAYEMFDRCAEKHIKRGLFDFVHAIKSKNLRDVALNIYNRFEFVLNFEEVSKIKEMLKKSGALNSCMTGSGSAVYGIFNDEEKAQTCKKNLYEVYDQVFLTTPVILN